MFKFIVILLVVVWLASFFFGSRRKLIRDVNHLLQLILFAALAFIGSNALNAFAIVRENHFVRIAAVVGIFFASWGIALLIRGRLSRNK